MTARSERREIAKGMRTTHGGITIDDARLPLVDAVFSGKLTPEMYADAFTRYDEIARRTRYVLWRIDMRRFDPLSVDARTRKAAAEIFARHRDVLVRCSVAEARVVENVLTRHILTAFDWLTDANKWPCRQCATMSEAHAWLAARYVDVTGRALEVGPDP